MAVSRVLVSFFMGNSCRMCTGRGSFALVSSKHRGSVWKFASRGLFCSRVWHRGVLALALTQPARLIFA